MRLDGYGAPVPYPPRAQLRPLPEFAGTASARPDPGVPARVGVFIVEHYRAGRSLRELSELTDGSFSAVRNILSRHGVHRRTSGATPPCTPTPSAHDRPTSPKAGWPVPDPRGMAGAKRRRR